MKYTPKKQLVRGYKGDYSQVAKFKYKRENYNMLHLRMHGESDYSVLDGVGRIIPTANGSSEKAALQKLKKYVKEHE